MTFSRTFWVLTGDPHVPQVRLVDFELESQPVLPSCRKADCVVLLTDHSSFDYEAIANQSNLTVDTRNAFRAWRTEKIVRL